VPDHRCKKTIRNALGGVTLLSGEILLRRGPRKKRGERAEGKIKFKRPDEKEGLESQAEIRERERGLTLEEGIDQKPSEEQRDMD